MRLFTKALLAAAATASVAAAPAGATPFINHFSRISTLATTVPARGPAAGDQNPYGVAVAPDTTGNLVRGDVLVSNFNNAQNQQGTGSSIVEISPRGSTRVFAVVPPQPGSHAVGLTTALAVLQHGFVVVGNLPAPGGNASAAGAGSLTILSSRGRVVERITPRDINGPWDLTATTHGDHAVLFVTNVLVGTVAAGGATVDRGTVVRLELTVHQGQKPHVDSNRVIATGFGEHTDPNALVVGPTGVGLGADGTLYVADSDANRIAAIPHAQTRTTTVGAGGKTLSSGNHLNDPLGLAVAPNGDVITANGGDGNIVETTAGGRQVATRTLVPSGAGDLFGVALAPGGSGLYFVNDSGSGPAQNSLQLLHQAR